MIIEEACAIATNIERKADELNLYLHKPDWAMITLHREYISLSKRLYKACERISELTEQNAKLEQQLEGLMISRDKMGKQLDKWRNRAVANRAEAEKQNAKLMQAT